MHTRKGVALDINPNKVLKQELVTGLGKDYYMVYMKNGSKIELSEEIQGVQTTSVKESLIDKSFVGAPTYEAVKLPRAEDCTSVQGAFCAAKPKDEHEAEKYKGEMFFTVKTSPGIVIKKQGKIIHDTDMASMPKRR